MALVAYMIVINTRSKVLKTMKKTSERPRLDFAHNAFIVTPYVMSSPPGVVISYNTDTGSIDVDQPYRIAVKLIPM